MYQAGNTSRILINVMHAKHLGLRYGFWEKLLKVVQQIWCFPEQFGYLAMNVGDWSLFSLISLQNFQKLFVDLRLVMKAIL